MDTNQCSSAVDDPDKTCIVTDFKVFTPEFLDDIQLDLAENITIEVFFIVQTSVDFTLEGCFKQVSHHVVEVSTADQLANQVSLKPGSWLFFKRVLHVKTSLAVEGASMK